MDCLDLGNIDAKRDWGSAQEYVEGMWRVLQQSVPNTFVLATCRTETVRAFVTIGFAAAGFVVEFRGTGEAETAVDVASGKTVMRVNPRSYRPAEVDLLIGSADKANRELGWAPKTTPEECAA